MKKTTSMKVDIGIIDFHPISWCPDGCVARVRVGQLELAVMKDELIEQGVRHGDKVQVVYEEYEEDGRLYKTHHVRKDENCALVTAGLWSR